MQYRSAASVHAVDLDGEVLIWDGGREHLHRLNRSATRIWNQLGDWRSVDDIAAALGVPVGATQDALIRDVSECLSDLTAEALLEQRS